MARQIFLSGEIKEEFRGEEVITITKDKTGMDPVYEVFQYPIDSKEFAQITGIRAADFPVERAYLGLSRKAADMISIDYIGRINRGRLFLADLDNRLIHPNFLRQLQ